LPRRVAKQVAVAPLQNAQSPDVYGLPAEVDEGDRGGALDESYQQSQAHKRPRQVCGGEDPNSTRGRSARTASEKEKAP
jgi:hypothetical protein